MTATPTATPTAASLRSWPADGPRVAVLGAGPVGLDAALAMLDAGFTTTVYEAGGRVGAAVRAWGHVRMFTPWPMAISHRMRRRLDAAGVRAPEDPDRAPTGAEFVDRVLDPLAALPELLDVVSTGVRVLAVGRHGRLKHDAIGNTPRRAATPLRLLLSDGHREWSAQAEVVLVLDCTGSYGRANPLGDGGLPAPGETGLGDRIVRHLPDLGPGSPERARFAGRTTRTVWAVRDPHPDWGAIPNDTLPERQALVAAAEAMLAGRVDGGQVRLGVTVDALHPETHPETLHETDRAETDRAGGARDGVAVSLRHGNGHLERVRADEVLGLTGYLGDTSLYRALQVHECYATAAPMNLAASLLAAAHHGDGPVDCLTQPAQGIDALRCPEPDFFILGVKSYGHTSSFLLRSGYAQVDQVARAYTAERGHLGGAGT